MFPFKAFLSYHWRFHRTAGDQTAGLFGWWHYHSGSPCLGWAGSDGAPSGAGPALRGKTEREKASFNDKFKLEKKILQNYVLYTLLIFFWVLSFKWNMSHHELKEKQFQDFDKLVWYYFEVADKTRFSSFCTLLSTLNSSAQRESVEPCCASVASSQGRPSSYFLFLDVLSLTVSIHVELDELFA